MNDFTISDLEVATDVPRRTIYFYVQQGVLPPPSGAGLAARYHRSHLIRLQAIPRLRSRGWRLDRIREFFDRGSDEDVAAVVEGRGPADAMASAESPPERLVPPAPAPLPPALIARYSLAPGVDLFVQRDLAPSVAADVARLLEAAARIFNRVNELASENGSVHSDAADLGQDSSSD